METYELDKSNYEELVQKFPHFNRIVSSDSRISAGKNMALRIWSSYDYSLADINREIGFTLEKVNPKEHSGAYVGFFISKRDAEGNIETVYFDEKD